MSYVDLVENILTKKEEIKATKRTIECVDPDDSIDVASPASTTMTLRPRRANPSRATYHVGSLCE